MFFGLIKEFAQLAIRCYANFIARRNVERRRRIAYEINGIKFDRRSPIFITPRLSVRWPRTSLANLGNSPSRQRTTVGIDRRRAKSIRVTLPHDFRNRRQVKNFRTFRAIDEHASRITRESSRNDH